MMLRDNAASVVEKYPDIHLGQQAKVCFGVFHSSCHKHRWEKKKKKKKNLVQKHQKDTASRPDNFGYIPRCRYVYWEYLENHELKKGVLLIVLYNRTICRGQGEVELQ